MNNDETRPYSKPSRAETNAMRLVMPIGAVVALLVAAFAIGGSWQKASSAALDVQALEPRVRMLEQSLATVSAVQAEQLKTLQGDIAGIRETLEKLEAKLP